MLGWRGNCECFLKEEKDLSLGLCMLAICFDVVTHGMNYQNYITNFVSD